MKALDAHPILNDSIRTINCILLLAIEKIYSGIRVFEPVWAVQPASTRKWPHTSNKQSRTAKYSHGYCDLLSVTRSLSDSQLALAFHESWKYSI